MLDTSIIRKRLSTFMSSKGSLAGVSNDVAMEVLRGWESWTGASAEYCRQIGITSSQLGTMIKKAKGLIKKGVVTESEFREVSLEPQGVSVPSSVMEVRLENGRVIGFSQVDLLIDFLKKTS